MCRVVGRRPPRLDRRRRCRDQLGHRRARGDVPEPAHLPLERARGRSPGLVVGRRHPPRTGRCDGPGQGLRGCRARLLTTRRRGPTGKPRVPAAVGLQCAGREVDDRSAPDAALVHANVASVLVDRHLERDADALRVLADRPSEFFSASNVFTTVVGASPEQLRSPTGVHTRTQRRRLRRTYSLSEHATLQKPVLSRVSHEVGGHSGLLQSGVLGSGSFGGVLGARCGLQVVADVAQGHQTRA